MVGKSRILTGAYHPTSMMSSMSESRKINFHAALDCCIRLIVPVLQFHLALHSYAISEISFPSSPNKHTRIF